MVDAADGVRDPAEDSDLMRARRGDAAALDRLLRRLRPWLAAAAHRRLGARLAARVHTSDILQSTLLELVESLRAFRGRTVHQLNAWAAQMLENNLRDAHRHYHAGKRGASKLVPLDPSLCGESTVTPSREAIAREQLLLVGEAMAHLSPDQRHVLILRMQPNFTHDRAAHVLDRSTGACRILLARARARLTIELARLCAAGGESVTKSDGGENSA